MAARNTDEKIRSRKSTINWYASITCLISLFPLYFLQFPSNVIYMVLQPLMYILKAWMLYTIVPNYSLKQVFYSMTMVTTIPLLFSIVFVLYALQLKSEGYSGTFSRYFQYPISIDTSAPIPTLTPFGRRLCGTANFVLLISLVFAAISLLFCLIQNISFRDYCERYRKKKITDILYKWKQGSDQAKSESAALTAQSAVSNSKRGILFPDVWTEFDVNSFKEIAEIGSGGQGQVFKAKTGRFGEVAVKVYNSGCEVNNREIESMQQFTHHPNIIRLFGYVQNLAIENFQTNRIGYVMEYMENGSVHDAIYHWNPPYTYDTGLSWICQIGRGLCYLHDKNVIHRDVKPRNLLLCNDQKTVKLCDFGLARVFGDEADMTAFVGTPKYMAPEMIRGRDQTYSAGVDVYSMAVTAWEILVRRDPFGHLSSNTTSNFDISQAIVNGERPVSTAINDFDMEAILKRAWSEKEEDRPSMEGMSTFFEHKCPKPETELRRRATSAGDDSGFDETMTAIEKTQTEATLGKKIVVSAASTIVGGIAVAVPAIVNYFIGED